MPQLYNDPINGDQSSIGSQIRTDKYHKKALIEARKLQYFMPLSSVRGMPKHMGKTIKQYHYIPLLDDANINDQGIDAAGATITKEATIVISRPEETVSTSGLATLFAVGEGSTPANAITAAKADAVNIFKNLGVFTTDYATTKTALEAQGWTIDETAAQTGTVVQASGNLYGSSKDIGKIVGKMPLLSETGGRVNRVGFTRVELKGTIEKYGFFDEYSKESVDFDTDEDKQMHVNREMINGATEMSEDLLQIDLLNGAGVVRFGGDATGTSELTGEDGETASILTYDGLGRLNITLDQNRCPKHTKVITGTRMIDTKVLNSCRIAYIGSELEMDVRNMLDAHGNPAFIGIEHYAAGTTPLNGEIGAVGQLRFVVVPEMMHWAGVGKAVTNNGGYRETNGKYDVFPMLIVGDESFVNIGFQTDGETVKFKIKHVEPESDQAYSQENPYGELGFMSIKWYYGSLITRPERIALYKVVASQ